jgi:hypothetical protein
LNFVSKKKKKWYARLAKSGSFLIQKGELKMHDEFLCGMEGKTKQNLKW